MQSIFEFDNYRQYLAAWIDSHGSRSHGLKLRIAEAIGVSSSLVSQVMKGSKTLTADQTSHLCDFLGLSEMESDYLHILVDFERASSPSFRDKLQRKRRELQKKSKSLGTRVPRTKELTDEQKAIYYSSWLYTGIRNLVAIPGVDYVDHIQSRLQLDAAVVNRVIHFLLSHGLCIEKDGKLTYGPAAIHVDKDSPFVNKHHQNWRFQAIQMMERKRDSDVFFTGPMSLSREAVAEIRGLIPSVVERVMKISGPSPSETVACLNIDWFEF